MSFTLENTAGATHARMVNDGITFYIQGRGNFDCHQAQMLFCTYQSKWVSSGVAHNFSTMIQLVRPHNETREYWETNGATQCQAEQLAEETLGDMIPQPVGDGITDDTEALQKHHDAGRGIPKPSQDLIDLLHKDVSFSGLDELIKPIETPVFTQEGLEVYHGDEWHECIRFGFDIFGNHAYQISSGEFRGEFNATGRASDFREIQTDEYKAINDFVKFFKDTDEIDSNHLYSELIKKIKAGNVHGVKWVGKL